jgi:hypothetical protein
MARKTEKKETPGVKYPSPLQYRWRAGPYRAPVVKTGSTLHDEYQGDVTVAGMTDAPIPWPGHSYSKGRHSGLLPILTGDLVRAVCEEEELVVSHYWGVTRHMVNQWKCAIADSTNSDQVALKLALKRQDPQFRKKYGYT